jgi:signal transduction histidine kinase
MPWIEALTDPVELRRSIRDLINLSTLPARWTGSGPDQIAEDIIGVLLSMLDTEFIYLTIPSNRNMIAIEIARPDAIRSLVSQVIVFTDQTMITDNPLGEGPISVCRAQIGEDPRAFVLVGSTRHDFPSAREQLLLDIAGNDMAVALERWRAEADEKRLVSVIVRSSDFIALADLSGRPWFINPAGLALVGLPPHEDAASRRLLDFIYQPDWPLLTDQCWPGVLQSGRWLGEIRFRNFGTGEAIPVSVDAFRIDNPRNSQPMSVATINRDLRAGKRAESDLRLANDNLERRVAERTSELEEANENLLVEIRGRDEADTKLRELQAEFSHAGRLSTAGQMAAAIAHELNQPLTTIANSANAARRLLMQREEAKAAQLMDEIAVQSLRAGHILRRLRDFISRGEIEKKAENVPSIIREALSFARAGLSAADIPVHLSLDPAAASVFANRIQVQQVMVNLMRNAFEAMAGTKRPQLRITTERIDRKTIEIAIIDVGPGLAPEVIDRLFEPFLSTKSMGMGLGLSLCRSIVEAHGGKLRYEPNPAGGAAFKFTLRPLVVQGEDYVE